MKRLFFLLLSFSFVTLISAQTPIDVLHYRFHISVNDGNDSIYAVAFIRFVVKEKGDFIQFDLASPQKDGKGMLATVVGYRMQQGIETFKQENNKLIIPSPSSKGDTAEVIINYKGIPGDGLIIGKNKYNHRTFFADNWPDRAHNWIPCHDDPADKASVEFHIVAPSHYRVVANGVWQSEKIRDNTFTGFTETYWKEDVPIPTKVMVIGLADFAVQQSGMIDNIPVSSWVYPEDSVKGFYDYAQALEILPFYIKKIGPYGYKKLANVQSSTRFGGMENANTIFYSENSISGKRQSEGLLAHEIAHQWFGNMATERTFAHLWLSEGFATYMSICYMENKYGTDSAKNILAFDRKLIINFSKQNNHCVVDTTHNYMELLNINSYQKGGWILHMLRRQLGDSVFWKGIRAYYAKYAGSAATTDDLRAVFEKVSGKNLEQFFRQWLYTPGQPSLDVHWRYMTKQKNISITAEQSQKNAVFSFPLEIAFTFPDGTVTVKKINISKAVQSFQIPLKRKPLKVQLDPNISLLFSGSVNRQD